ncbi:MAG: stage III sporulation protein AF [Tissierellia bacterium]|nr:stage III sporulation protein AF [Tissierellia bacterium]
MAVIEFLTLWIKDIAIIFVLISIIQIVLPNNNMKRYVDMIIGFLIIIVIISPFVNLLYKDFNIDKEIFKKTNEQIKFQHMDNLDLDSTQEEQIKEIYTGKIKDEIRDLIHENTNYKIENVNVSIYEDNTQYGNIKDIELILKEDKKKDENKEEPKNLITISNIQKISIGENKELTTALMEFDDKEIKNLISKNHNISEENIRIFLNTLGEGELGGETYY